MQRETKFRGKSLVTGKWIYGSLLQSEIDVNEIAVRCEIHERFASDFSIGVHSVDPKTVGQYTGPSDKNGKEIYEGDILKGFVSKNKSNVCEGLILSEKLGKEVVGNVCFSPLYAQFYFTTDGITYLDLCFGLREREVIGNVFESPELLTNAVTKGQLK